MKNNIFEIVEKVLKTKEKYVSEDNKVLKAVVYTDVMTMNNELLSLLLSNEQIKERFFEKVDDTLIFDKQKFAWFLESKEFLPDSYTSYTNKIGLTNNGNFISKSNDVVLDFPYKDCVLEGGQSKDDQKRNEIFYNETIASDEITRMLAPKVFTNAKRYTKDGVEDNIIFNENDNLIIKGNNLIALSSLLKRYEGQVKCIYIDPPYNTGNDSFNYNDSFNHSTWLTFMKNRLELAKRLLRDDGVIFVHCDNNEQAYLKVLMDDIFGRENFVITISLKVKAPSGVASGANMFFDNCEYILVYSKDKNIINYNHLYVDTEIVDDKSKTSKNYNLILEKFSDKNKKIIKEIDGVKLYEIPKQDYKVLKMEDLSSKNYYKNFDSIFRTATLSGGIEKKLKNYINELEDSNNTMYIYEYIPSKGKNKGETVSNIIYRKEAILFLKDYSRSDEKDKVVYKQEHVTNQFSNDWWQGIANEGGVKLKNGKKPEILLNTILQISTNPEDIILDFHLGSGTTCAVAHKMGRRYIGIEQMDYIEDITVERMKKVIDGEQGGISKSVNWNGGGSFVYCELKENANELIEKIQSATEDNISEIKEEIYSDERIIPYITTDELKKADEEFLSLNLEEKKHALISLVDKNKLYVNYSDMDDHTFNVTDKDKRFTKSFYKEV